MASSESGQLLPLFLGEDFQQKILSLISAIFEEKYKNPRAISKLVSKQTGIPPETIRKWRKGCNSLCLEHFLLLAKHYPEVLKTALDLIGQRKVDDELSTSRLSTSKRSVFEYEKVYSAKYCTINLCLPLRIARELNQRQWWFLGILLQGDQGKIDHIVAVWGVSRRMAKYDVKILVKKRLIQFRGGKKNGWYEAIPINPRLEPENNN